MSNLIRGTITSGLAIDVTASLGILIAWTGAGWATLTRVVTRRQ